MVKFITLLLFLGLSFAVALPAEASFCRNSNNHLICILSIKRSAKNYWEYRAAVSVDGVKRPLEVYNCRDGYVSEMGSSDTVNSLRHRVRIPHDGIVVPFEPNSPGELICRFF